MSLVSYIQQYFNTSITVLTNQVWKLLIGLFKVPNIGVFTVLLPGRLWNKNEAFLSCWTFPMTDFMYWQWPNTRLLSEYCIVTKENCSWWQLVHEKPSILFIYSQLCLSQILWDWWNSFDFWNCELLTEGKKQREGTLYGPSTHPSST